MGDCSSRANVLVCRIELAVWKDTLYCLGWKDGIRGIYEIDLATMDTTLIYSAGKDGFKGFINGFSLNY